MRLLNREGMCTQQWCTHEQWEIHAYMDSVLVKHQVPIYQRYLLHESFYFFWSTWKCIELQPQPNSHNLTKELTTASGLSNPKRRLYIILTCSHLHCLEISIYMYTIYACPCAHWCDSSPCVHCWGSSTNYPCLLTSFLFTCPNKPVLIQILSKIFILIFYRSINWK